MKRHDRHIVGLALLIAVVAVNFLASRHFLRLDLTANREYSLTPSTKQLLTSLDDVVTVRVYFTRDLPAPLLPLRQGIDDLLAEYKSYAGAKIQIEYPDPHASPQTEQEVQILGISQVQLNVVAKDKREVARVYLGIAIFHGDRKHVIPVIDRSENLEYELTAGILRVAQEKPPTIGWWAPTQTPPAPGSAAAPNAAPRESYETVRQRLQQRYTLKNMTDGSNLTPTEVQALILVSPRDLAPARQFAIDQYLAAGGHVLALVDRVAVEPNLSTTPVTSGLEPLLTAYGLTVNQDLVADASNTYAAFGGGGMTIYRPYPFWVVLHRPNFDASHPTVARLEQITFPWASSLTVATAMPEGLSATVLARSTKQSGVTAGEPPLAIDPESAVGLLPAAPSPERPMAVLVAGKFTSAFGAGKLTPPKGMEVKADGIEGGQLLVVGTSRMIEDRSVRQFGDGLIFFENAVDALALGDQLIGIRSRAVQARPIATFSDAGRTLVKYANTFGVSLLVVAAGLYGIARRRARYRLLQLVYR